MSIRVLAFDTTGEFGSIAIAEDGEVVDQVLLHSSEGFGHILFGHLERLLTHHHLKPWDIACFAAASGPGSFTGVRVGLSAAKGLAEASGRSVAAVSNLQAIAAGGSAPLRAAVLDARRGEVYGAVYGPELRCVLPETVGKFQAWLDALPEADIEFLSTDLSPFEHALRNSRFTNSKLYEVARGLAAPIALIAAERLRRGATLDPAAVDANYVRRSDAELFWKE